jgi:hypothetical protein
MAKFTPNRERIFGVGHLTDKLRKLAALLGMKLGQVC